jgi:hypothetical protein
MTPLGLGGLLTTTDSPSGWTRLDPGPLACREERHSELQVWQLVRRREPRRRSVLSAPLAIATCLLFTGSVMALTALRSGPASPNTDLVNAVISSPETCYPQDPIQITDVLATAEATNVTLSWEETPAGSHTTLDWGNNSSEDYTQAVSGSGSYSVFLDFLQPVTRYYYEVLASPGDNCHLTEGRYSGEWNTSTDSSLWINGTVVDNASNPANNLLVDVTCLHNIYDWAGTYTTTNSGSYSLYVGGNDGQAVCDGEPGDHGFVVTTMNVAHAEGSSSSLWANHWNETVIIWAPEIVNFVVPIDYATSYIPGVVDFSNAPAEIGYTELTVGQSASYENIYTYSWSLGASVIGIGGGGSGSVQSETGVSATQAWQTNQQSLCVAFEYNVSGTVQFNATTREWAFDQALFGAHNGEYCNDIDVPVPANWFDNTTNTSEDIHFMPGPSNSSFVNGLHNVPLWKGDALPYELSISSSSSSETAVDVDFELSASLYGVTVLSFAASEGWSQTVTSSTSIELGYNIEGPSSTSVSCYNVFGEGGSLSGDTADMIAIYYWTGSVVNNDAVCA